MQFSPKQKRFVLGLVLAATIGIAFCLAFSFNLLHGMQLQSSDFLFRAANLSPAADKEKNIVIVAIDDKSLDRLGHFSSWPRSYHAQLIDGLVKAAARVIVFDVLFSESTSDDDMLMASIKRAGNVALPLVYNLTVYKSTIKGDLIITEDILKPLEIFEESALAIGHANVLPDEDGVVRRLPLIIHNNEQSAPALSLAAVAKYLRRTVIIESPVNNDSLPFAGRSISIDNTNSMLINYTGDSAAPLNLETVSYSDVLRDEVNPTVFQDKIVIVGITATGFGDTFWTPMGRMMSGVEIHAIAMHTLLTGNFLSPASYIFTISLILSLSLLCGIIVLRLRVLWATISAALLCIAYFLTAFSLFDRGIVLNMLYPPIAVIGTFVGMNIYTVAHEQSEKMELTKTFGRYISPSVVDKILGALGEDEIKLGGEEQEVTIAFADVRGFTGISESIPSEELVRALNIYLSVIIDAVLKHGGMINKFAGDNVMAIWNVPIECEGHALLATRAAISAQHALSLLLEKKTTLPRMEFGIGVNTGKAVAGNMGSQDRLEYSVIGDAVNIAARLADITPGGKVWIGDNTYRYVADNVTAMPLKPLQVKGKREQIQAYEVMAIHDQQSDNGKM